MLDGGLLHEGAKAGEVLRAEADFELEGIVIISVAAPKTENRPEPQRIEIVGPGRPESPGVTTQLAGRGDRRPGADRRRDRPPRERTGGRPQDGRDGGRAEREGGVRTSRGERRPGTGREPSGRDSAGREHSARRSGEAPRPGGPGGSERDRQERRSGTARTSSTSERGRGRRLSPGSKHRREVLETLPPEQQAIAEHLLRGGIPAVRTALHLEREKAQSEGRAAPNSEELLALAESLLPRLRAAEWRDRAEAAVAEIDNISLRDLRSVVAGADLARDDETRALGAQLREGLERKVAKLHSDWAADIVAQLESGKTVRAVRLSGRAPDPSARLDSELAARLTEAASSVLGPETAPDLWAAMLEAVAESPIRRSVQPTGLPAEASPELKRAAHQLSGSIPALAKLLGITIPPPPAPGSARRRGEGGGPRQGGRGSGRETRQPAPAAARSDIDTPLEVPPAAETGSEQVPPSESGEPEATMPESGGPATDAPEAGVDSSAAEAAISEPPLADPIAVAVAGAAEDADDAAGQAARSDHEGTAEAPESSEG